MRKVAFIPARYAATRFPAKLMQNLAGRTIIETTYNNTIGTGLFDEVCVVTDSPIIYATIEGVGGKVLMSKKEHQSGSDRIAEVIETYPADIVINVQGDEPFVDKKTLEKLLNCFEDEAVKVASLMQVLTNPIEIANPNYVKVVVDKDNNSLLFSRSPIPYHREKSQLPIYYEHIGVYAFRKETLLAFSNWAVTPLEQIEKIECLRYLEHGIPLKMVLTDYMGIEIDTPEDLLKANEFLKKQTY